MSLYKNLTLNKENISFHTPGHANFACPFNFYEYDFTELFYSDNLLNPAKDIKHLETSLAKIYHTASCLISTNGATNSIFQAMFTLKDKGSFLFVGQCHSSVYNAARIMNLTAYHIDRLEFITNLNADIKTIVITSPDYFGNCQNLTKLSDFCKSNGLYLIIDASHGSHFVLNDILPVSAAEYGDLVIHSLHKTLPVATGGSVLCVKKSLTDYSSLARRTIHSTSPSYPVIISIEKTIDMIKSGLGKTYGEIKKKLDVFTNSLDEKYQIVKNDDFTRLVIKTPFDGHSLLLRLSKEFSIDLEAAYGEKIVAIINPFNYNKLSSLCTALNSIKKATKYKPLDLPFTVHNRITALDFSGEIEFVNTDESVGKLAATEIGFYPPGVPLIYSHDIITKEAVKLLNSFPEQAFGLVNGGVPVVKCIKRQS